ncbi:PLAC8 family protein isoform X1 [Wolffia australiana]
MHNTYEPPQYIPLDPSDLEAETAPVTCESSEVRRHIMRDSTLWSSGICACFDDMPSCCMGFFCPCILFGKNAELLGAETLVGPCLTHFILWGLVNGMCCLLTEGILIGLPGSIVAFYACGYRSSLRAKYNLQEAPCGDLATHLFCHVCALCQEYREIRERMGDPGPSDPHLAVVKPPSIQKMESDSED